MASASDNLNAKNISKVERGGWFGSTWYGCVWFGSVWLGSTGFGSTRLNNYLGLRTKTTTETLALLGLRINALIQTTSTIKPVEGLNKPAKSSKLPGTPTTSSRAL